MDFSIFGTPKPFVGKTAIHQRNAIKSWTLHSDDVLLFDAPRYVIGPESLLGFPIIWSEIDALKYVAAKMGARLIKDVRCNEAGLPYIDDMFGRAQALAKHDLMVYANADVIFSYGIEVAMERAADRFDQFLLVGQRYDIDLDELLDFTPFWQVALERIIATRGELHSVSGKDWFGFRRPLPIHLRPYVVGRPMWDNDVLDAHLKVGVPVIDATRVVTVAHPNHEIEEGRLSGESFDYNMALGSVPSNQGRISEATWIMTPDEIIEK